MAEPSDVLYTTLFSDLTPFADSSFHSFSSLGLIYPLRYPNHEQAHFACCHQRGTL